MRKALVWVLVVAAAYAVSCGSSSSSSSPAPPPTPALSGTIGGKAFTPTETMALNFGSDGTPCLLHLNPMDPSAVTTVGVKAVVVEAATFAGTCTDLQASQCQFHANSQKVTMLVARVNLVPPGSEPPLTTGTYTVSADLAHPTVDSSGAYVAFAQTIAIDPSFAASTGTSVAGGTIQLTDVAGPVTGTVSLTFTDGSALSGTFSAPFCPGTTDACGLAGTLATALAGGGPQGLCTLPPVNVP
jgi:hypothetical protein